MEKISKLVFPDFNEAVCSENLRTISEAESVYRQMLLDTGVEYNVLYANKISEMKRILKRPNLVIIKEDTEDLIKRLTDWKKQKGYTFPIYFERRKKSDVKCHTKIRLYLTKHYVFGEDVTLDGIKDTLGIRIIPCFGNTDTLDSVKICYEILEEIIKFFTIEKGYNPCQKGNMFNLTFDYNSHPEVIVPSKSLVSKTNSIYVKDYYAHPKSDGYQSLHIVFDGNCPIEVQIRTFATHLRVDSLHDDYNAQKYDGVEFDQIHLNREKVNIHGYGFVNGFIHDKVGLETSIDPYNQLY